MKTDTLITQPSFNFSQGEVFDGAEMPITVSYFNNGEKTLIELCQEDRYINFTSIDELKALVKLAAKYLPEAEDKLK